jgi:hypothetical protein
MQDADGYGDQKLQSQASVDRAHPKEFLRLPNDYWQNPHGPTENV